MTESIRRVVTGHDAQGKSIVLSDGPPPQYHSMLGPSIGADFFEIWNVATAVPILTPTEPRNRTNVSSPSCPPAGTCCGSSRFIRSARGRAHRHAQDQDTRLRRGH